MRPGLTGLWQVSGRNSIDTFDDIVALDIQYIRDWNIWLDLRILARTVFVVFFPGTDKGI
jgi:lipopolysaccharide/colanic/teichoic acid biosynthesis glycosyltransferase